MDVASFICSLRSERILWTQLGFAALITDRGWEFTGTGGFADLGIERRTYSAPWGWRWNVSSTAGVVCWSWVILRHSQMPDATGPSPNEIAAGFEAHYLKELATVRSILGPEGFEGTRQDIGEMRDIALPNMSRLAWWDLDWARLRLALTAANGGFYCLAVEFHPLDWLPLSPRNG